METTTAGSGSGSGSGRGKKRGGKPKKASKTRNIALSDDEETKTAAISSPLPSTAAAAATDASRAVSMEEDADADAPYEVPLEHQGALQATATVPLPQSNGLGLQAGNQLPQRDRQEPLSIAASAAAVADASTRERKGRGKHGGISTESKRSPDRRRTHADAEREDGDEDDDDAHDEKQLGKDLSPQETLAKLQEAKEGGPQVIGRIEENVTNERLKELFEEVYQKWTNHAGRSVRDHMIWVYGVSNTPFAQEIEIAYRLLLVEIGQLKQWFMTRRIISQTGYEMRFNKMFEDLWDSKLMLNTESCLYARRQGGGAAKAMDMLRFKPMNTADLKPVPHLILYAQRQASMMRLRKRGNYLYREIRTLDGKYGTHAWQQWKTFESFLMYVCNKNQQFQHWTNLTYQYIRRDVITFLRDCEDDEIPFYLPQSSVTAWEDPETHKGGLYFAESRGWVPFGTEVDDSITACKKFDRRFPHDTAIDHHMDLKTPLDSILEFQEFTREEMSFIWAMIGRMVMTPKLLEGWEQFLMLWGQARAGKGCILEAVRLFMPKEDTGFISNKFEPLFGLQKYILCKMVLFMDIKRNFELDAGTFQCMISHEPVSIAVKNKEAVLMEWLITMMGAGNEFPWAWRDRLGSMADRFVLVRFWKKPTKVNTSIKKTLEPNIGFIYRKAVLAYHHWVEKAGPKDIGGVMPHKFLEARNYIKEQGNPLECFLSSDQVIIYRRTVPKRKDKKGKDLPGQDPEFDVHYCLHSVFMETYKQYAKDLGMRVTGQSEDDMRASLMNRGLEYDFDTLRAWPPQSTNKKDIVNDQFYIGIRLKKPIQDGRPVRLEYPDLDGKLPEVGESPSKGRRDGGNKRRKSDNNRKSSKDKENNRAAAPDDASDDLDLKQGNGESTRMPAGKGRDSLAAAAAASIDVVDMEAFNDIDLRRGQVRSKGTGASSSTTSSSESSLLGPNAAAAAAGDKSSSSSQQSSARSMPRPFMAPPLKRPPPLGDAASTSRAAKARAVRLGRQDGDDMDMSSDGGGQDE